MGNTITNKGERDSFCGEQSGGNTNVNKHGEKKIDSDTKSYCLFKGIVKMNNKIKKAKEQKREKHNKKKSTKKTGLFAYGRKNKIVMIFW